MKTYVYNSIPLTSFAHPGIFFDRGTGVIDVNVFSKLCLQKLYLKRGYNDMFYEARAAASFLLVLQFLETFRYLQYKLGCYSDIDLLSSIKQTTAFHEKE